MTPSQPASAHAPAVEPGGRITLIRLARPTAARSVFVLTAPLTVVPGAVVALVGLAAGLVAGAWRRGSVAARLAEALVRRPGDLEWWRTRGLLAATGAVDGDSRREHTPTTAAAMLPDLAYAVIAPPLACLAWLVTALWWTLGLALASFPLRSAADRPLRPLELDLNASNSHLALTLGLTTPAARTTFAVVMAVAVLATLPLVVRACAAALVALARELLSDAPVRERRLRRLRTERDRARASAVAAVTAETVTLRRLERDIHDGPQQHLVRLAMDLGRAQRHVDTSPELVRGMLGEAIQRTRGALEELRSLSRGIAPPVLTDRGLVAALSALAARSVIPAVLDVQSLTGPVRPASETAAYFVVAEALTNAAKHSGADRCTIGLRQVDGRLEVRVADDGGGGAHFAAGHGLQGLADRAEAAGGCLSVASPPGGPTTIVATLP